MKISCRLILLTLLLAPYFKLMAESACNQQGLWLQVLGSGGPELDDGRASSGYLIWQDGSARILVDMGGGSLLHYEKSGASIADLDVILMTHFHVDHSNDLPALIKASFFTDRSQNLTLYGPTANHLMPSATDFTNRLFGDEGAFHYLHDYIEGTESYRLIAVDVAANKDQQRTVFERNDFKLTAIPVHHGPIPAVAWRIDIGGQSVVFSGDMSNRFDTLWKLADQADILVAHHAITEKSHRIARNLHMPPSEIGSIAARAKVKQLVLSHRMKRTYGKEKESLSMIHQHYHGPVYWAEDLQCFRLKSVPGQN